MCITDCFPFSSNDKGIFVDIMPTNRKKGVARKMHVKI